MHESTQLNGTSLPRPLPLIVGAQQFKGTDTSLSNATHATGRTGSIVYIHAVAEQQRTGNLHFFMIKTQATPNIQHFIYSILLTDNHDKIFFSVIKHIVHLKKKVPDDAVTISLRIATRRNHRTT